MYEMIRVFCFINYLQGKRNAAEYLAPQVFWYLQVF